MLNKSVAKWPYIVSSLPVSLLMFMFAWQLVSAVLGGVTALGAGTAEVRTIYVSSSRGGGSKCFVRTEFSLGSQDGHWCGFQRVQTGSHEVHTLSGSVGTLIVDPPGIG
jgi:hypothetical protein